MTEFEAPNAQQHTYWNEVAGPKWVELDALINDQIEALGLEAIERAAPQPGESVLDVGCGCGHSSFEIARRVGESGQVVGVDLSEPMLALARSRASDFPQLGFEPADAQAHVFAAESFDLVFSRFGVMFFEDPLAAFGNLLDALAPRGRFVFVCWQEIGKNPWMAVPGAAALQHLELPAPPDPFAPGPFAFAEADRVAGMLEAAGFESVRHFSHEGQVTVGRGLSGEQILEFLLQMGPAGAAMREASPEVQERVRASVSEAVEPLMTDGGMVADAATWIVHAEKS
jgi:SAM-dependent methyltransferase